MTHVFYRRTASHVEINSPKKRVRRSFTLQLITDDLSETQDSQQFWDRRRKRFTGFRNRRAKA